MIKTAPRCWASHSAHGLRRSWVGGPLSSLGQNGRGGMLPTAPGAGKRCSCAWPVGAGGDCPFMAARARAGDEGGSGEVAPCGGGRRGGRWQPTVCGPAAPTASRQWLVWVGVTARGSRGMVRHVWAAREHVGCPGEGRSWAGPERTVSILI
jgi:hypothetical protein